MNGRHRFSLARFAAMVRKEFVQMRRDLDPPAGKVLHRGMSHEAREALGERRARQSRLGRERLERPGLGRPGVDQRKRAPDAGVAQPGEPPGVALGQARDMAAHDFHEQELAEVKEHTSGTRASLARFRERQFHQLRNSLTRGSRRSAEVDRAWERLQLRIEGTKVASE